MVDCPSSWESDGALDDELDGLKDKWDDIEEDWRPVSNGGEIEACELIISVEICEPGNHLNEGDSKIEDESWQ